jgi:hypothetical protein
MDVPSTVPVIPSRFPSSGKSKVVPPGLARRGLDLPPGIAKKLEAGGTAPAGIAKRFPAAAVPVGAPTPEGNGTDADGVTSPTDGSSQETTPSVDLLV